MITRRTLFVGAAAAAATACVPAMPAAALPPRLLDVVPCDGRALRVCDYLDLFEQIGHRYGGSVVSQTFRVPDARGRALPSDAVECDQWTVFPHIVAKRGEAPVGLITLMVVAAKEHCDG
jgi:microcystin-dependent protein